MEQLDKCQYELKLAKTVSTPQSETLIPPDSRTTRARSINNQISQMQKIMNKKQVMKLIQLKQQLLIIRQRKKLLPVVPDPEVVNQFNNMKQIKHKLMVRQKLKERIQTKKKELIKMKHHYSIYALQFDEKNQVFKQKSALLRVLGSKMEAELGKTKQRYREVQFNRVISLGVRKVLLYRLTQILFNENVRNIFNSAIPHVPEPNQDCIGNCLGYLALFMCIVGEIVNAKMWINFHFKGPRSTIKLSDGAVIYLHPRQPRFAEGIRNLCEQLYQLMHDRMHLKVENTLSFYELCEQLSKQILTVR